MLPALLAWVIAFGAVGGARHLLQGPAASPAVSRSPCYLPSGVLVDAPDSSISSEYYYSYVTTYSYSSYAINYYAYYSAGTTATPAAAPTAATPAAAPTGAAPAAAPMAAAPTQVAPTAAAPAPAPQYPVCCPTQTVQQGDTVTSLLTAASQPPGPGNSAAILFYAMNPDVTPGQPLQPGITVTVPCYRILEYFRDTAPPSPVPAPSEAAPCQ